MHPKCRKNQTWLTSCAVYLLRHHSDLSPSRFLWEIPWSSSGCGHRTVPCISFSFHWQDFPRLQRYPVQGRPSLVTLSRAGYIVRSSKPPGWYRRTVPLLRRGAFRDAALGWAILCSLFHKMPRTTLPIAKLGGICHRLLDLASIDRAMGSQRQVGGGQCHLEPRECRPATKKV